MDTYYCLQSFDADPRNIDNIEWIRGACRYLHHLVGTNPHLYLEEYERLHDIAFLECRLFGLE